MRASIIPFFALAFALAHTTACTVPADSFTPSTDSGIDAPSERALQLDPADITVGEGETATLTVRAVPTPDLDTTVTLTTASGLALATGMVVVGPGRPTATVDLTALEDDDAQDGSFTVTANADGHDAATSRVTVEDDELMELIVVAAPASINENGAGQVSIKLSAQPAGDVSVGVMSSDPGAATVSTSTLTFGVDDWNTPRTIDVAGVLDPDTIDETITVNLTSPPLDPRNVTISVIDIDRQGILTEQAAVMVREDAPGGTLRVYLAQQPTGMVTVDVGAQHAAVHVNPTSLTFDAGNYNMPKTVTITTDSDDDVTGFNTTVRLSAPAVVPAVTPRDIAVNVIDDDVQAIMVAAASPFRVAEEGSATFTARLRFRPAADTVVGVMALDQTVASTSPAALTFHPNDWNQPQTVTTLGLTDVDTVDEVTKIRLTAPGVDTVDLDTTIVDDDTLALVVVGAPVTVSEGGSPTFTVALSHQPPAPITVAVSSSDALSLTALPALLPFDGANWSTPQTVTLRAIPDADLVNEQVNVTLASPPNLMARVLPITIQDQTMLGINTSAAMVTVTEGAGTATFTVTLSNPPNGVVAVGVMSNNALVSAAPMSLSFGPGDWMMPKTVTVAAMADDDIVAGAAILTLSSAGLPDRTVGVTTTDNDQVEIQPSAAQVAVTEGQSNSFTVRLGHKPTGNVTVNVAAQAMAVATVGAATLDFTPANWNVPRMVTVTGAQDNDLAANSTTVNLTGNGLVAGAVTINVTDDDQQALVLAATPATIIEGGATATFTVRLAYQPAADVAVTVSSNPMAAVTIAPAALTFTAANWSTTRDVVLTAPVDDDLLDGATTITVAAPGNAPSRAFDLVIDDPDVLAIIAGPGSVAISEGGAGAAISVKLNKKPGGQVAVGATSNLALAAVSPPSRTFDASNWNQNQTYTVTAPIDDDTAGGNATITLHAAAIPQDVTVTAMVTDPDQQAIVETAADPLAVTEGGTTSFGVHLRYRPTADVTVTVAPVVMGAVTVAPGSMVFTAANWNVDRPVMVAGAQDANLVDATATVRLTSAGLGTVDVAVAVDDDDLQQILVNPASLTVTEGGTATVAVTLRYQPAANTTVTVATSNGPKLTVSGNLTFGAADYNLAQNVTLTAVSDADVNDETAVVTLGNFDAPLPTTVQVTVDDVTIITDVGWSTYFGTGSNLTGGTALAYQITVSQAGKLDGFGVITGAAGGEAKMALYANSGGVPGALVASVENPTALGAGTVILDANDSALGAGTYWVAIRVNPSATVGATAAQTGTRCSRSMATFTNAWPATFGAATCVNAGLANVFVRTYRP